MIVMICLHACSRLDACQGARPNKFWLKPLWLYGVRGCEPMACWEVTGGVDRGGIIVREGQAFGSQKAPERLRTGAVVRELAVEDGRLQYELVQGSGPATGWVSVALGGRQLLQPVLDELPSPVEASKWVAKYKHQPTAVCRLLCAFGAGADASSYDHWNALVAADFPDIELVLLQLPGRGQLWQEPLQRRTRAAAELIVEELQRIEGGAAAAPTALLGFSMGAAVAYEVELRLEALGRRALCLYVAGRGGPGISYRHPEEARALAKAPEEYVRFFATTFCPPDVAAKLLRLAAAPEEGGNMLRRLRDNYRADLELGNPFPEDGAPSPVPVSCGVHVVVSRRDTVWPAEASAERSVACTPAYGDIVETWREWTTRRLARTVIFDDLEHHELCGERLLRAVCGDVLQVLSETVSAPAAPSKKRSRQRPPMAM
ncbi:unnamed protein product [Prorocentrum cordatum]|uniref:Thioesterase domain-containing protein n=1 Tax=Prorocentrum cordatum TaxID=2364126 RepID=A0ABN9SX27_9DINO|nr:unnamed protein product [Polarella glacialis]